MAIDSNPTTPVISMRGGYGIAGKNYITGLSEKREDILSILFFGYEFGTDRKVSWTIGAGMMIQKAYYYAYRSGTTFADEDILFQAHSKQIDIVCSLTTIDGDI